MSSNFTRKELTRCVSRILGLACCAATTVAAQQPPKIVRAASAAFRPADKSDGEPGQPARARVLQPTAASRARNEEDAPNLRLALPAQPSPQPAGLRLGVLPAAPLRITADRTSFLTEARIPIAELWSGRLWFTAVQQRFHAANLYSVLSPAYAAEVAIGPGTESIVARSRVNYGFGLQLRFGR